MGVLPPLPPLPPSLPLTLLNRSLARLLLVLSKGQLFPSGQACRRRRDEGTRGIKGSFWLDWRAWVAPQLGISILNASAFSQIRALQCHANALRIVPPLAGLPLPIVVE